jgi:hypothetical protein
LKLNKVDKFTFVAARRPVFSRGGAGAATMLSNSSSLPSETTSLSSSLPRFFFYGGMNSCH